MTILFLGSFYPKNREHEIYANSKLIDIPGNILQWNYLNGLNEFANLITVTVPFTKSYKGTSFKESIFSISNNHTNFCIGFVDVVGVKQLSSSFAVYNRIKKTNVNIDHILIYSTQINLIIAALRLKIIMPNVKISLIITDIPQYMSINSSYFYKLLKKINNYLIYSSLKYIDSYILLSKHMVEKLPSRKPNIVIEGIYNEHDNDIINKINSKDKVIFYSGALSRQYGVINLIKAFNSIQNCRYQLILCGDGDAKEEIIKESLLDPRIKYIGRLSHKEVLNYQKKSDLLINPRTSDNIYTRYSFPSKTIEYLASGTPTLLYRLDGIPDEYYNYCFTIDEIGIEALAKRIEEILGMPEDKLKKLGKAASIFIRNNKSAHEQCKKLFNFLTNLSQK